MIDLHSHILPGLDDGAPDIDSSVAIARMAEADGVTRIVGTPHVRDDHPYALEEIGARAEALNGRLRDDGLSIRVEQGAEVAMSRLPDLDDEVLAGLCLGNGRYVLVEAPYVHATDMLETMLSSLQIRGFRPVLAHPERSPSLAKDLDRLARLVEHGVLCSVTAGSMAGRFGRTVRRTTRALLERGLVHNVASDAHDTERRPPVLRAGFSLLDREVPGLLDQIDWYTCDVPAAILAGERLPARPPLPARRRPWRLLRRAGR